MAVKIESGMAEIHADASAGVDYEVFPSLIAAYDGACALTVTVTAAAKAGGVFNPQHASTGDRAGGPRGDCVGAGAGFGRDRMLPP